MFTEYVEGSSYNKALEISNLGTASADLSAYVIEIYSNHGTSPTTITLTGTLAVGTSYVICNPNAAFAASCDRTSGSINFNGNDAVRLASGGNTVDRIGDSVLTTGNWPDMQYQTLRRKCGITSGDTNFASPWDTTEWDVLPLDDSSGLGSPACLSGSTSSSSGSGSTSSSGSTGSGSTSSSTSGSTGSSAGVLGGGTGPALPRFDGIATYSWDDSNTRAAVVGNFDADSVPDAVVLRDASLLYLHGNGDGTFNRGNTVSLSGASGSYSTILAADLNKDGHLDLLVAQAPGSELYALSVYLGRGDGTFDAPISVPITNAEHVALADVNGDGAPDLLAVLYDSTNHVADKFACFLGNGDGTFAAGTPQTIGAVSGLHGWSMQVGDFNGDTKTDAAILVNDSINSRSYVYLLAGDGAGNFSSGTFLFNADDSISPMFAADLDGDGDLDLVVNLNAGAQAFTNDGSGNFTAGSVLDTLGIRYLAAGELTGDSFTDVVWDDGLTVSVYPGLGSGNFGPPMITLSQSVFGVWSGGIQLLDLDGDGRLDFVDTNADFSVYLNRGDGSVRQARQLGDGGAGDSVAFSDFNGDGKVDVVVSSGVDQRLTFWFGDGDGGFLGSHNVDMHLTDGGALVGTMVAVDLDGDGRKELITSSSTTVYSTFIRADGGYRVATQAMSSSVIYGLHAGFLAGDALPSIAGCAYPSYDVQVLHTLPDAGLANAGIVPWGSCANLEVVDLDGDGLGDLVSAGGVSTSGGHVDVLFGEPDGGFGRGESVFVLNRGIWNAVVGDFNGDGLNDVLTYAERPDGTFTLTTLAGLPDAGLGSPVDQSGTGLLLVSFTPPMRAVDLDGDGDLDLVTTDALGRGRIFFNDGTGQFTPAAYLIGDGMVNNGVATDIQFGDLNGDGRPDIAFSNNISNGSAARALSVLLSK